MSDKKDFFETGLIRHVFYMYKVCPISPVSKKLSLSDMYANTGNYVNNNDSFYLLLNKDNGIIQII